MNEVDELTARNAESETVRRDTHLENQIRDLIEKTITRFGHLNGATNDAGSRTTPCSGRP